MIGPAIPIGIITADRRPVPNFRVALGTDVCIITVTETMKRLGRMIVLIAALIIAVTIAVTIILVAIIAPAIATSRIKKKRSEKRNDRVYRIFPVQVSYLPGNFFMVSSGGGCRS